MSKSKERKMQRLKESRLIDNGLMDAFFDDNKEAAELLIRIILNRDDITVINANTERYLMNLLGRSIKLDIHAQDKDGKRFDVEFQRDDRGTDVRRARYHSAMLDSHMLNPGDYYDKLKDSYVIFITENDVLNSGKPLNRIERINMNSGEQFNDGEHIMYVNGADKDCSTELGKLMHDLYCENPDDMFFSILADKMRYFKTNDRGINSVMKYYDKWDLETIEEEKIEIAMNMIMKDKFTIEDIADVTGLSVEKVTELAQAKAV